MPVVPTTQRAWWELLQAQTSESAHWKELFDFNRTAIQAYLLEIGSIKKCARMCAEYAMQGGIPDGYFDGLNHVHPHALLMLSKYGVEYKPFLFEKMPWEEPKPRACFENSALQQYIFNRMSRKQTIGDRMNYVEGIALGWRTEPVLHAWNTLVGHKQELAIDWTWYAVSGWTFYLGLPITQHQHARLRKLAYPEGGFHLLLSREVFPRIEDELEKIMLKNRSLSVK